MKADWHPRDGFEVLKQRIKDGMMYAAFSNKPINSDDALNMMMVVITRTRLFSTQYQEWHAKQLIEKNTHARVQVLGTQGAPVEKI